MHVTWCMWVHVGACGCMCEVIEMEVGVRLWVRHRYYLRIIDASYRNVYTS